MGEDTKRSGLSLEIPEQWAYVMPYGLHVSKTSRLVFPERVHPGFFLYGSILCEIATSYFSVPEDGLGV